MPTSSPVRRFAARHPIAAFLMIAYPVGWLLVVVAALAGLPQDAATATANLVGIFGPAVLVTYLISGRDGVRRLLSGLLRWRLGASRYLLVVAAMPAATLLLMAATGTAVPGNRGWPHLVVTYLVALAVTGLSTNLWEEAAWAGFVQARLMGRRGMVISALVTAPLFVGQHLPLLVVNSGGVTEFLTTAAILVTVAIFFRYLIAGLLVDTAGSLLAAGLLHASSDAAGKLTAGHGGWQQFAAFIPVALLALAYRSLRRRQISGPVPALDPQPAAPATPAPALEPATGS